MVHYRNHFQPRVATTIAALVAVAWIAPGFPANAQLYEQLSPFQRIDCEETAIEVELEDGVYRLQSINGVETGDLVAFCKEHFGEDLWEDAFATRLVEILTRMGHRPGKDLTVLPGTPVELQVRPREGGDVQTLQVPLSMDSWRSLRRKYETARREASEQRSLTQDPDGWLRSPFTSVRSKDGMILVEYEEEEHQLVSVNTVSADALLKHASRWEKLTDYFLSAKLGRMLFEMGHPIGEHVRLELRKTNSGVASVIARAKVTRENASRAERAWYQRRSESKRAARAAEIKELRSLSNEELLRRAVDEFEDLLEKNWAYKDATDVDFAGAIDSVRLQIGEKTTLSEGFIALRKVLALGIDGHTDFSAELPPGYLPFRLDVTEGRFVAFRPDRSDFVVPEHPFVTRIDGKEIAEWQAAALEVIPRGSPSFVQSRLVAKDAVLLNIQYLRSELGIAEAADVEVEFESRDGKSRKTFPFAVAKSRPFPTLEAWPCSPIRHQGRSRLLPGNVGYLRLERMQGVVGVVNVNKGMDEFRNTRALIVDVRGNGGGGTEELHAFLPYLMRPDEGPQIVTLGKWRLESDYDGVAFDTEGSPELSDAERSTIRQLKETFQPQWNPPADRFSEYYYECVERSDNEHAFHYNKPVIVLQDDKCLSATDIFLAALKGRSNVTLVGTPSAGGVGSPGSLDLLVGEVRVRLSRFAAFRPNGAMFDGKGVEPDILIEPTPKYFIGKQDNVLERALALLQ